MKKIILGVCSLFLLAACGSNESKPEATESKEVNVYTHRHYDADKELFAYFEKETGIKVNVVSAKADELINRMEVEGAQSPADVLITVDAGRLYRAKEKGLFQSFELKNETCPSHLMDADKQWVSLTQRGRVVVYSKERVDPSTITSFEDLTKPEWKGKVLVRSSSNLYNQSLMASLIHHYGEEAAEKWATDLVANTARSPKGNDRDQVKAILSGQGDVAIVNTYYIGKLLNSKYSLERAAGEAVGVIFPTQGNSGVHMNVSGAGVAKYAPNKENAVKFIEYLLSEKAQNVFAKANYEYPVHPNVQPSELLSSWGTFAADSIDLSVLGANNQKAVMLFDKAGWK